MAVWEAATGVIYIRDLGMGWLCAAVGRAVNPSSSGVCRFFFSDFVCGLGMEGFDKLNPGSSGFLAC